MVDWLTINFVYPSIFECMHYKTNIRIKKGLVCRCILQNVLICTPYNGRTYITTDIIELNENSSLEVRDDEVTTYKNFFRQNKSKQFFVDFILKLIYLLGCLIYLLGHYESIKLMHSNVLECISLMYSYLA